MTVRLRLAHVWGEGFLHTNPAGSLATTYSATPIRTTLATRAPGGGAYNLSGSGLETWIYRRDDLLEATGGGGGLVGTWCNTPATDSSGHQIFIVRRWIAALALYPRIARGTLDFHVTNLETGPASHIQIGGPVQVERHPQTLAPLGVPGRFNYSDTWGGAPLQMLQLWYDVVLPEFYGINCSAPHPSFSDTVGRACCYFLRQVKINS